MQNPSAADLRPRVGDLRQYASVRRIVLEDGPEHGMRAIAFSTGGGLEFWLMTDKAMDIGPLWFQGVPIAWQAPGGFVHPALQHADSDDGRGIERTLSGFLVTCGLDHVRQPGNGRPLHGRLPMTPARILAAGEDWTGNTPLLYAEGEMVQYRLGGEHMSMRRRIEAPIGGCELYITDTVRNEGACSTVHDLLYHFNLGYPAISDGSRILLDSQPVAGPLRLADPNAQTSVECHSVRSKTNVTCTVLTPNCDGSTLEVRLNFDGERLGYVQLWSDLRPNCGVMSIEPCVSKWVEGGHSEESLILMPGESVTYKLSIACQKLHPKSM